MKSFFRLIGLLLLVSLISCSRAGNDFSCLEDLEGHSVGVIQGSALDLKVSAEYPRIRLHRYTSNALMVKALSSSKVEAALMDTAVLADLGLTGGLVRKCFSGIDAGDISFGFNREDAELCARFNYFLAETRASGLYDEILQYWTSGPAALFAMPDSINCIEDGEPLTVGILGGNIPFAFVTGDGFAGLEPELLERFAASIGRSVKYHEYELSTMVKSVQNGKTDVISALLSNTSERQDQVLFSDPYYHSVGACLTLDNTAIAAGGGFADRFRKNLTAEGRFKLVLEGLGYTFLISLLSILFGTLIGIFLCTRLFSKNRLWWHRFMEIYGSIMRGVPLLMLLLFMYYVVFATSSLSAVTISVITFAMYFSYVSCEVFRSGVESVSKGQMDEAMSLGFSRQAAFRHVLLPQAVKNFIPFYEEEAMNIMKETSLVGFIAVIDLTKASELIQSRTFDASFPIVVASIIYYLIALLIGWALKKFNEKHSRGQ